MLKKTFISYFIIFIYTTISALPAPMSKNDLIEVSDFIGEIKVISVMRISDDTLKYTEPVYQYSALAQIKSITKSIKEHNISDAILLCWSTLPKNNTFVGGWYVEFKKGEHLLAYLKLNNDKLCYEATSWNMKYIDK